MKRGQQGNSILGELPHILIFLLLLLVLLVVVTRFGWVHCSEVPGNWCEIYCKEIMRSHSRVAVLYGNSGIGDAQELEYKIRQARPYTYLEMYDSEYLSAGMLDGIDLIILEEMDTVSFTQALAIRDYLSGGGSAIWIGDAATNFYVDDYELQKARVMDDQLQYEAEVNNYTLDDPHYYENALLNASTQRGFYFLSEVIAADFVSTNQSESLSLKIVNRQNLIANGISPAFELETSEFTVVAPNPQLTNIIAVVNDGANDYPGIFETRYGGKVVYVAFPLEKANSTTLLMNLLDYLITC